MKSISYFLGCLLILLSGSFKAEAEVSAEYPIHVNNFFARDPFVFVSEKDQAYYMHVNENPQLGVYKSPDLENWKFVGKSFTPDDSFWGTKDFWAPDTYYHKGKYYIFATFSSDYDKRGTSILVSNTVTGPYTPLENYAITPYSWTCLDGSLYVDDEGQPWLIFCREWLEVKDGEVYAQKLLDDLTMTDGDPILLFKASSASWVGNISSGSTTGKVTDAPFIYKSANGQLLLIWSSFTKQGKYAIGLARSSNGKITGKWTNDTTPLNADDGGHAMIFKDLKGQLRISYHSPNSGNTRPKFLWLKDNNGKLTIENSQSSLHSLSTSPIQAYTKDGYLSIKMDNTADVQSVRLLSTLGKEVKRWVCNGESELNFPLRGIHSGCYLLQLTTKNKESHTVKVIIS